MSSILVVSAAIFLIGMFSAKFFGIAILACVFAISLPLTIVLGLAKQMSFLDIAIACLAYVLAPQIGYCIGLLIRYVEEPEQANKMRGILPRR